MNKTKPILAICITLLLLNACGTISEGLGGSKKKGNDEFLVEKKAPLILPPSFGKLPEPVTKTDQNVIVTEQDTLSIEKMVSQNPPTDTSKENSLIEKSIIEKIQSISKPGLRVYSSSKKMPRVLGGFGTAIISTSRGLMTDRQARSKCIGGEILCYIW